MLAVNIDFGECFAQPVSHSLAALISWREWLRSRDPIRYPEPRGRDQIIQPLKAEREEPMNKHKLSVTQRPLLPLTIWSRSPPYRPAGRRRESRPAACANRDRRFCALPSGHLRGIYAGAANVRFRSTAVPRSYDRWAPQK